MLLSWVVSYINFSTKEISKKLHKKGLIVKFPKDCSSFCQFWFEFFQLCSRSNNIDLDSSCSNNLHWFLGQLLDIQPMLQSSFSRRQRSRRQGSRRQGSRRNG